ncbi:MAG: helix-turn-helix transcriptional regulator, partial [Christensenellaceae bacterium]
MSLGDRIRSLRGEKNLSQNDLAELLKVSRQSISKWETDGATPDLDKLVSMSEIFGVTLDTLIKGIPPM